MAAERLKSPRARLFVALQLPERVRAGLVAWQDGECRDPALRLVPAQALHVTLCFLGHQPERVIERVGEIIGEARRGPVPMRLEPEPVPLPGRRPRLFAVGVQSDESVALQAELAGALEAERLYRPEKREFWPHVTVARVRSRSRVKAPPGPLPEALCRRFDAVRVALYRSFLRPQGAEYVCLSAVDLLPAE